MYIAVEVFTARDKLSGALSLAIDKLGGEDGAHGFFGSPVKRLQRYDTIIQSIGQHESYYPNWNKTNVIKPVTL